MCFYDVYISIGSGCRPAYHLALNDLRIEAYPLDWMSMYSLDTVIHLFKTKFVDFFVDIEEDNTEWDGEHRWIKDITNNIVSVHHFSRNVEVKKEQKNFLHQMDRRFKKLDDKLEKAKRIVLVAYRVETIEKLQLFLKEFSSIYPHLKINLINMRNDETMNMNSYDKKIYVINDYLTIEEYSFNDTFNSFTNGKASWCGNMGIWGEILNNYKSNYYDNTCEEMKKKVETKNLVIYGAGQGCLALLYKFERHNIKIKGIAVTNDANNPKAIMQYGVKSIEEYEKDDFIVISLHANFFKI